MSPNSAWNIAYSAALDFSKRPRKAEFITEHWKKYPEEERRRAYRLFQAWLRGRGLSQHIFPQLMKRPPRTKLRVLLELACSEMLVTEQERHPAIVSHTVDFAKARFSQREAGLCNAVLRRAGPLLIDPPLLSSHPHWLSERWHKQFGSVATDALMQWNQQLPVTYLRWSSTKQPQPDFLITTKWPNFYQFPEENRRDVIALLDAGEAYIQDPFTRFPVEMAIDRQPLRILDLCAAPGGKTRALLDALDESAPATVVACDLPGARLKQLEDNLKVKQTAHAVTVLGADVRTLSSDTLQARKLPASYDAVILDVPCSNTGVIQRKPDVRWILDPEQYSELLKLQLALLENASKLVSPGGKLIYSTCSLEPDENELMIDRFLKEHPEFSLAPPALSRPWTDGHDGGGAFPLTRE
jgi:16S rRNA (cytosine967-C5)-methyltransferase